MVGFCALFFVRFGDVFFAFCKCRLPQMTIIVQHFSEAETHTHAEKRHSHRDTQRTACAHTKTRAREKCSLGFFRPMIATAVSSIAHIPIHKSSVGSINKAFNKCNSFFFAVVALCCLVCLFVLLSCCCIGCLFRPRPKACSGLHVN